MQIIHPTRVYYPEYTKSSTTQQQKDNQPNSEMDRGHEEFFSIGSASPVSHLSEKLLHTGRGEGGRESGQLCRAGRTGRSPTPAQGGLSQDIWMESRVENRHLQEEAGG